MQAIYIIVVTVGLSLTLGNAILAYVLATNTREQRASWMLKVAVWVLFPIGISAVVAPIFVLVLRQSALANILHTPISQWAWAVIVIVTIELLMSASIIAITSRYKVQPVVIQPVEKPTVIYALPNPTNIDIMEIESKAQPHAMQLMHSFVHLSDDEKKQLLEQKMRCNRVFNRTELAKQLGISRTSLYRWMNKIEEQTVTI